MSEESPTPEQQMTPAPEPAPGKAPGFPTAWTLIPMGEPPAGDITELRKGWIWFLILGAVLVLLGIIALGALPFVTRASLFVFGVFLFIGGGLEIVHAFWRRKWSGFFLDLLIGVLYLIVGFWFMAQPLQGALVLTLVLAAAFIVGGAFRIAGALTTSVPHQGWLVLGGVVNVLLGIIIWAGWPLSGFWVPGLFVAIDLLVQGWCLVMLALAARSLPEAG
jgi:uncharacterized membrane protein HdeD (DUF308 family)